ncbi:hypothetical protein L484_027973 [Morus notabilis]|uniref:Uncharacterized protein n=1 Tax=Morus notabilis TaxID=981085 RepID=W9S7M9_9ROSA|nr:hypothetical protein L484_027973 [Morus notabilis]
MNSSYGHISGNPSKSKFKFKNYEDLIPYEIRRQPKNLAFHGRLLCSSTGNHVSGTDSLGLAGVDVVLRCVSGGNRIILASAITDITGIFEIFLDKNSVNKGGDIPSHSFSCNVIVNLPIASCTLLPAVGYLQAPLNMVKVVTSMVGVTSVYETGLFKLCFHYYAIDVN